MSADHLPTRDRGSGTLSMVILMPMMMLLFIGVVQMALWTHTRSEVRSLAHDSAVLIARGGTPTADVTASLERVLSSSGRFTLNDVTIERTTFAGDVAANDQVADVVTVQVVGSADGLFYGLQQRISVTEAVPVERFRLDG